VWPHIGHLAHPCSFQSGLFFYHNSPPHMLGCWSALVHCLSTRVSEQHEGQVLAHNLHRLPSLGPQPTGLAQPQNLTAATTVA
jgi:hypothetical protein